MILYILAGLLTDWKIDTAAVHHEFQLTYWKNRGSCSALTWFYHSFLCPLSGVPVCNAHQHSAKMFLHRRGHMVFFSDPESALFKQLSLKFAWPKKTKQTKFPGGIWKTLPSPFWCCGSWGCVRLRRWGSHQNSSTALGKNSIASSFVWCNLNTSSEDWEGKHNTLADQSPRPDYGCTHAACGVGIHRNMIYKSSSRFPSYTFTKTLLYIILANSSTKECTTTPKIKMCIQYRLI